MNWLDLEARAPEGWFSQYDMAILCPPVSQIPSGGLYLEIGVHKGRSLWAAKEVANDSVIVCGIDTSPDPEIPGTEHIQEDSHKVEWDLPIDVLFIDANHSYEDCKADIETYVPWVVTGGVVLFHDYDKTSPGVIRAVDEFLDGGKPETFGESTSMAMVQL